MNKNVKEKRYFIDEMNSNKDFKKETALLVIISFIIGIIVAILYCNINMDKLNYELSSYSSENLDRLDEVFDIFITEGSRFDLSYIPEDVKNYSSDYEGDTKTLHYELKYAEDFDYAPLLYMDVTLSKDLKVLEKSKSYVSKEEYIKSTKSSFYTFSFFIIGFFLVPTCTLMSYIPAMLIGMLISSIHKKIDLSKESKKETEG